jgi:hypothetical protein
MLISRDSLADAWLGRGPTPFFTSCVWERENSRASPGSRGDPHPPPLDQLLDHDVRQVRAAVSRHAHRRDGCGEVAHDLDAVIADLGEGEEARSTGHSARDEARRLAQSISERGALSPLGSRKSTPRSTFNEGAAASPWRASASLSRPVSRPRSVAERADVSIGGGVG